MHVIQTGATALYLSSENGHINCVCFLVEAGTSLDIAAYVSFLFKGVLVLFVIVELKIASL